MKYGQQHVDGSRSGGLLPAEPEPVDPLLAEVENIFEPPPSVNEVKCMLFTALKRGMDPAALKRAMNRR